MGSWPLLGDIFQVVNTTSVPLGQSLSSSQGQDKSLDSMLHLAITGDVLGNHILL